MSTILERFLIQNKHNNFKRKDISLQLQTHPQNPSFRAITDTLDYFGIENVAANVPQDALSSLPNSFITLVDPENPEMILLIKKKNSVDCITEDGKRKNYSISEFERIWIPQIIVIEEGSKNRTKNQLLLAMGVLFMTVSVALYLWLRGTYWLEIGVLILALIGFYLSQLLAKEKLGIHSPVVDAICTSTENRNCDKVLNSRGSMITKNISLADASIIYFSILIFQLVFFGYNGIIAFFILLSVPVILFSLYYQAFVLKTWCPLCLGVAFVLVVANVLVALDITFIFAPLQFLVLFISVLLLIPAYFFIKNLIVTRQVVEEKLFAASQFKRNPNIVANLMNDAKVVDDLEVMENEIRIGNPEATNKIIAFTNPFCGFCKAAFESYVKIIKAHLEIEIWMRFNVEFENEESISTTISARLAELYFKEGQETFINAYLDWFENKDEKE